MKNCQFCKSPMDDYQTVCENCGLSQKIETKKNEVYCNSLSDVAKAMNNAISPFYIKSDVIVETPENNKKYFKSIIPPILFLFLVFVLFVWYKNISLIWFFVLLEILALVFIYIKVNKSKAHILFVNLVALGYFTPGVNSPLSKYCFKDMNNGYIIASISWSAKHPILIKIMSVCFAVIIMILIILLS